MNNHHQNRVTVIPANPEAVREAQKRKERRDAASEELIHLQHRLLSASIQLLIASWYNSYSTRATLYGSCSTYPIPLLYGVEVSQVGWL